MGALKILCYCDEMQMERLVDRIADHLSASSHTDIENIDETIGNLRLCVDFEVFMDKLGITSAEVLDSEWDVLYEDTCVLNSRLRPIIDEYNRSRKYLYRQARDIRSEQRF